MIDEGIRSFLKHEEAVRTAVLTEYHIAVVVLVVVPLVVVMDVVAGIGHVGGPVGCLRPVAPTGRALVEEPVRVVGIGLDHVEAHAIGIEGDRPGPAAGFAGGVDFIAPYDTAYALIVAGVAGAAVGLAKHEVGHAAVGAGGRGGVLVPGFGLVGYPVVALAVDDATQSTAGDVVEVGGRAGGDAEVGAAVVGDGGDAGGKGQRD